MKNICACQRKCIPLQQKSETTGLQLENLKSNIARHIGLVRSLHLPKRCPAAMRDLATPNTTPQHPYHHAAASVRYTVRSPPRLVERTQPIARRRCREGDDAHTMQTTAELSELECGDGLAGIGWVIIGGLWVGERPQPVGSNPP